MATLVQLGSTQLKGDRCVFILVEDDQLVAIAGLHVDDLLVAGSQTSQNFLESGKPVSLNLPAASYIKQRPDNSIPRRSTLTASDRWIEEITIDKSRSRKAVLSPEEDSALRGALGTISWRSMQSAL